MKEYQQKRGSKMLMKLIPRVVASQLCKGAKVIVDSYDVELQSGRQCEHNESGISFDII